MSRPTRPAETSSWDPDPGILNPGMLINALLSWKPAKALRLPADAFLGHRCGFLENLEVCNHGEMVGGECCWGKPVNANLLLSGHVQGGWRLNPSRVEDVVKGALLLPSLPDLPGGERGWVWVGRCKLLLDGANHCFTGVRIEVACQDEWPVLLHCGQPSQEILPLLVPQGGQQGSRPCLQVSRRQAHLTLRFQVAQVHCDRHLVALHVPHLQDPGVQLPNHFPLVPSVEEGTAVGTGVGWEVDARRVRLGHKVTIVAKGGESSFN